jgi:hypothetical protein
MKAPSPEWVNRLEALRQELLAQGGPGTEFVFRFTEGQLLDLASGYVPVGLKAAFMAALDWSEEDRRRAARPVQPHKRPKPPTGGGEGGEKLPL